MFIGHLALAFAARPRVKEPGLGFLLLAVSWADLVWPILLLVGVERVRIAPGITARTPLDFVSYPWSHSLVMHVFWGVLLAWLLGRGRWTARARALFAGLVVSHWVLDWISHRPDMPLWPGGPKLGLGLWNSVAATTAVESSIFAAGLALYLRATAARGRKGRLSLWSFVILLAVLYGIDTLGRVPPPSERALAWFALASWLLPLWGVWVERTRTLAGQAA
jgi:hypothetical protein